MGPMANATVRSSGLQPSTTAMHCLLRCMSSVVAHMRRAAMSAIRSLWGRSGLIVLAASISHFDPRADIDRTGVPRSIAPTNV